LLGLTFQVTQRDWFPVLGRQAAQFLVEHGPQIVVAGGRRGAWVVHGQLLALPPPARLRFGTQRNAPGNGMEPASDRGRLTERRCFAQQDQESGLEGILGVVGITQNPPADAPNQRPMAAHQTGKRAFVLLPAQLLEQLAVAAVHRRTAADPLPDIPEDPGQTFVGHDINSPPSTHCQLVGARRANTALFCQKNLQLVDCFQYSSAVPAFARCRSASCDSGYRFNCL
jgi:hypothetical protein